MIARESSKPRDSRCLKLGKVTMVLFWNIYLQFISVCWGKPGFQLVVVLNKGSEGRNGSNPAAGSIIL